MKHTHSLLAISALVLTLHTGTATASNDLPVLGDATSSVITPQQEHQLGRNWARSLRREAPLLQDPILKQYLNDLLWQLVSNSQLTDRRIEVIPINNKAVNAFAAPGGIIGVNGGLFLATQSEAELASVLAHEIAHLSQRHYAQQLEEERRNKPLMLAGLLASILVAAADPQAGTAAITSTLGASAQNQLAFSRRNEREADRIGMQTLVASGFDPYAMPKMFEELQRSSRFSQKPPEFLLTHPVTESRIADALNRASELPRVPQHARDIEFDMVRARMQVHYADDPERIFDNFRQNAKNTGNPRDYYGMLVAALSLNRFDEARTALEKLPPKWRQHPYVRVTEDELLIAEQHPQKAYSSAQALLKLYPDSMPVQYQYVQAARLVGQYQDAASTLRQLTSEYPDDTDFWSQRAETEGQAGNIAALHLARIQYYLLTGQMDLAKRQLEFARREKNLSSIDRARLDQKEQEIKTLQQQMKDES